MEQPEQEWCKALQAGSDEAYKMLYEEYFYALCSFATQYLNDFETAKDLVQDVLFELWTRKWHLSSITSVSAYLYQMVRNRCLDRLKHQKVEEKYFIREDSTMETEFFLNKMFEEEMYRELKKAIRELPEQMAKVYDLTLLGLSNAEIAERLSATVDAIKAIKKKGKIRLQKKMEGFWGMVLSFYFKDK